MAIILWGKKYTETLAETLKRFRLEKPEFVDEKVTYAGRLDPMAKGLVIFLTGADVHKKDEFLNLDKTYEVDFVFGPATDTYDILGILDGSSQGPQTVQRGLLETTLEKMTGERKQKYPPYSSKPVGGKPLFMWAREGRLDEITMPTKKATIHSINYLGSRKISHAHFRNQIIGDLQGVVGDFRQTEIINNWRGYFDKHKQGEITTYSIEVRASSGTYMRSLIYELGKTIKVPACTIKIKRTEVGDYTLARDSF